MCSVATCASSTDQLSPQERVEKVQEDSSEKLEDALDGVEENLDAKVTAFLHIKCEWILEVESMPSSAFVLSDPVQLKGVFLLEGNTTPL